MKSNFKTKLFLFTLIIFLSVFFSSCSSVGLLDERNSWMVTNINSIGAFLKVYIALQISILLMSLATSLFLGRLGYFVVVFFHFIWIVTYRDYGFFMVLLLFSIFSLISWVFSILVRAVSLFFGNR